MIHLYTYEQIKKIVQKYLKILIDASFMISCTKYAWNFETHEFNRIFRSKYKMSPIVGYLQANMLIT